MKTSICAGLVLTVLLAGCVSSYPTSLESGITGAWGEDPEDCETNPHTISFSPEGDLMHLAYRNAGTVDGRSLQVRFSYQVLGKSPSGLHVALIGESRKESSGRAVTWELKQSGRDSYCWRRSDWTANECTVSRMRCGL